MATYEVTDPLTKKTYELTGDSPPTEAELNEIFSGSQKASAIPQEAPAPYTPDYVGRPEDLNEAVKDVFANGPLEGVMRLNPMTPGLGPTIDKMRVAGGLIKRGFESVPASLLTAGAEAITGKPVRANILKALSGEEGYEYGDIGQPFGVPKIYRQIGGLGMAAMTSPEAWLLNGIAGMGVRKGANALGRHLAMDLASNNKEMAAAIIADGGKALNPKYGNPDFYKNTLDEFTKELNLLHKPASEAMDAGLKEAGIRKASPNLIVGARRLLNKYLETSPFPAAIERAIKMFDRATTMNIRGGGSLAKQPNVDDVVRVYRNLGGTATSDVEAHLLEQELRDMVSLEVPEMRVANDLWGSWMKAKRGAYRLGIDVEGVENKALRRVDTSGNSPLSQFNDKLRNWQGGLDDTLNAFKEAKVDPTGLSEKAAEITRSAIYHKAAGLPVPELNLAPAGGFAIAGQPGSLQIAAGVASSRTIRHLMGRNKMDDTVRLLNWGKNKGPNMLSVYKDALKKLVKDGNVTPAGKALADTMPKAAGLMGSQATLQGAGALIE